MVKRLKDIADASGDSKLGDTIKDSAQQIWLAGLGAFAKAQEEGAKVFDALVKEGKGLEEKTRKMTQDRMGGMKERMGDVSDQMNKAAQTASAKTNAAWDKLEQVFEDRVARSLNRLGVPTNKDVGSLSKQIDELSAEVRSLRAARASAAKKSAATKAPAKKAPAKKAAGKKTAGKRAAA